MMQHEFRCVTMAAFSLLNMKCEARLDHNIGDDDEDDDDDEDEQDDWSLKNGVIEWTFSEVCMYTDS